MATTLKSPLVLCSQNSSIRCPDQLDCVEIAFSPSPTGLQERQRLAGSGAAGGKEPAKRTLEAVSRWRHTQRAAGLAKPQRACLDWNDQSGETSTSSFPG